jgi:hypothetical protein
VDCTHLQSSLQSLAVSTKSREVIWGGQIMGAEMHPDEGR